ALQRSKAAEAAIATSEASRLEKQLAGERREASERILEVSEAYEKALEELSREQCAYPFDRATDDRPSSSSYRFSFRRFSSDESRWHLRLSACLTSS
ncbi:unnamed protein product, partial [Hapterophycus canaliculatus]